MGTSTSPTLRMAALVVSHKCTLVLVVLAAPYLFPSLFTDTGVARRFETWDSEAYVGIAGNGYTDAESCAFYPLWPTLIRIGSCLTGGHSLAVAWVLANLLSFGGLLLFHRLAWEMYGLRAAYFSTLVLLLFPGALFFIVPYAESIFFFLLMATIWLAKRSAWVAAACVAALLPLTRATGIFVLPLVAWHAFQQKREPIAYLACLGPVLGFGAYLAIMWGWAGSPWAGFTAQQLYPAQGSLAKIVDPCAFVHCFMAFGWKHDFLHSFIDRVFFIVFLVTLFQISRLGYGYYSYALLAGLVPAMSNSMMSFTRFSALVFPVFIAWGAGMKRSCFTPLVLMVFFGLQLLLLLLHISGRWGG